MVRRRRELPVIRCCANDELYLVAIGGVGFPLRKLE
jgi:hypothetical protein